MFVHIMIKGRGHIGVEFFKGVYGDQLKKNNESIFSKTIFQEKDVTCVGGTSGRVDSNVVSNRKSRGYRATLAIVFLHMIY